jgi:transposase-like protein
LKSCSSSAVSKSTTSPSSGGYSGSRRCWPTPPGSPGIPQATGGFVDETYVRVNGVWRYIYRAVDQYGQVIDVVVSARRNADAARRFLRRALSTLKVKPTEVVTDAAPVYPAVLDQLVPSAWHHVEQYANNPIEADHSRLKHRLRPMRGLRTDKTAQVIIAGHAFMQNLRRGHYELAVDAPPALRVATAFTELARAI